MLHVLMSFIQCAIEHVSTTSPRSLNPSFTLDIEQPCMGSDDWITVAVESGVDLLDCIAHDNSKHKDAVSESSPVDNLAIRGRLRPRKLKDSKPRVTVAKTRHRGNSPSEHDDIVSQQGSGRPIIYARSQLQSNSKPRKASPAIKYTLDDLMKESRKDHKDIPPYVRTSYTHMDSQPISAHRYTPFSSIQTVMHSSKATYQPNIMYCLMLRDL